jgi:hypothetical protein
MNKDPLIYADYFKTNPKGMLNLVINESDWSKPVHLPPIYGYQLKELVDRLYSINLELEEEKEKSKCQ